jgi:hypothetical protein
MGSEACSCLAGSLDVALKAAFEANLQTGKILSYYVCALLPRFRLGGAAGPGLRFRLGGAAQRRATGCRRVDELTSVRKFRVVPRASYVPLDRLPARFRAGQRSGWPKT